MNKIVIGYITLLLIIMSSMTPIIATSNKQTVIIPKQVKPTVNVGILVTNDTTVTKDELTNFKSYLENLPWANVKFVEDVQSYSDISTNDILIILGAITFENLTDYLNQFVLEGGSLLLAPPAANMDKFNNFTRKIGFEVIDEIAKDNSSYYESNTSIVLTNTWDAKSPIFNGVTKVIMPSAHPIAIIKENTTYKGEKYRLLWGLNTTTTPNLKGEEITLIAASELFTTSKVLITGTYSIFTNTYINLGDNRILAINIVKWLGNRFDYLKIQDVQVSARKVFVSLDPVIQVNFTITNSSNQPIEANAEVIIVRAGSSYPLITKNASYLGNGKYTAELDFTGIRPSIVELWIIAHKKYIGYYIWPEPNDQPFEITVYEHEQYQIFPDAITFTFFVLIPILGIFVTVAIMLPRYLSNRKKIKELEQKQEKSE